MPPKKIAYSKLSKSGKWYRDNAVSRVKKAKADKKINERPAQVKKRTEANKKRATAKKAGKRIKGKDYDHAVKRFVPSKTNRGRKGEGGRKLKR